MRRTCIDCAAITTTTRCPNCTSRFRQRYRNGWQQLSRQTRQAATVCAWCGSPNDLCADHLVPGRADLGVRALCRGCNTRRRNGAPHPGGG